ncbi:hypothetical protein LCGC14_1313150 [marine sediment metagenome]|uniref:Uncharacterized protein n=1 Tax=marine sediment metagenome TaxID=412755 RepID=A0A0F9NP44_9ZZZZ
MDKLYHAHVQHPRGSGYMMQTGSFHNVEEAVTAYLELVDRGENSFGRNALERYPDPIKVLLIPANLHGPDAMAYTGFCSVWNEDGSDAYDAGEPDYVSVPNPRYQAN